MAPKKEERDFADHLEAYLAKRDGVDKLLKISRYAAKLALASSSSFSTATFASSPILIQRLKSFESSVGVSRKAFRLGKFIQDVNALKRSPLNSREGLLALVAYGGEGVYYFVEQFVWLTKAGLIEGRHAKRFQMISAWAELVGYVGSIALKTLDLKSILEDLVRLESTVEGLKPEGRGIEKETNEIRRLREKALLKRLSIVQDLADAFMAIGDVQGGDGFFSRPVLMASAGFLSALISTHKNWTSC